MNSFSAFNSGNAANPFIHITNGIISIVEETNTTLTYHILRGALR